MVLALIIFSAIVPLVVYLKPVLLDNNLQTLFFGIKYAPDFFSFYKSLLIIISSILGLIIYFYQKKYKEWKLTKTNSLILIYIILIILSTIFSNDTKIALFGFYNLYEGCLVLISYIIMMYFTSILDNKKQIKIVLYSIIVSATIIGLIGIGQYFGYDIFRTNFFRNLIMPNKYKSIAHMLDIEIDKYSIYSTLSNPNYVGSYMAMLFPLSIGLFISTNNLKKKIFFGFFSMLMFSNLLGSGSKAGYLGIIIGIFIFMLLLRNSSNDIKKQILLLVLLLTLSAFGMFMAPQGTISEKWYTLYNSDIGNIENEKIIKDIKYIDSGLEIKTNTEIIKILLINDEISFFDNSNQYLNLIQDNKNIKIDDNRYKDYNIKFIPTDNIVLLNKGNTEFRLIAIPEYGIRLLNYKGEVITDLGVEKCGFQGKEKFASSRGYIWSRTIPLLKSTILIGHGPDTFVLHFPQNDINGKYKIYGTDKILVNKPHNMYLQIAINTGLLSLACFLSIIFIYSKSSIKSIKEEYTLNKNKILKSSIFTSIVSYLIAGICNDSMVAVAPVFWTLLGIGINLNEEKSL